MRFAKVILAVFLIPCRGALSATVSDVISDPKEYSGKRFTLEGIARVPGDFYLFSDVAAAGERDVSKAILVVHEDPERTSPWGRTFSMDRKWVRVTGVVNPIPHIPGQSLCEMDAERVQILSKEPDRRIKDPVVYGVFINALSSDIRVELSSRPVSSEFYLGPKGCEKISIQRGLLKIFTLKETQNQNVPISKRAIGQTIVSTELTIPKLGPKYIYSAANSDERTVYYRISRDRIELVSASDAGDCMSTQQK